MGYWRITLLVLLAITAAFWTLALIGTAALQAVCNPEAALPELQAGGGAPFRRSLSCGSVLRLPWAILALEAAALVGASLSLCLGGLAHSAMSWLAVFAVLSALSVFIADALVALQSTPLFGGGWEEGDRARTAQAGWVPLAALNALLAFWLGWRQQPRRGAAGAAEGAAAGAGGALPVKY